jgi:ribosomal protein S18 acetylase RimI-like enzyme
MPLSLRPALPADEVFLYQLIYENLFEKLAAWAWDASVRGPLLKMQIDGQRASYAAEFPHADHGIILLDDRPIGRLIVDRGPEIHHLVDITILKQNRRAGIGGALIRALCTEAEMMRRRVRLHVAVDNPARELYRRLGFQMIEDRQITWVMERGTVAT